MEALPLTPQSPVAVAPQPASLHPSSIPLHQIPTCQVQLSAGALSDIDISGYPVLKSYLAMDNQIFFFSNYAQVTT